MFIHSDSARINDSFAFSTLNSVKTSNSKAVYKTLPEFVAFLRDKSVVRPKAALPMLTGCLYSEPTDGTKAANVEAISMIVGDIDSPAGHSFDDIFKMLQDAGLTCVLETSASYTPDCAKVHIFCPLSRPIQVAGNQNYKAEYARLIAYLNGISGGLLGVDNNDPIRRYFYGVSDSVKDGASFRRVELNQGDGLLDELLEDPLSIITPIALKSAKAQPELPIAQAADDEVEEFDDNPLQRKKADIKRYTLTEKNKSLVIETLAKIDNDCEYDEWLKISSAIYHMSNGSALGRKVWFRWSTAGNPVNAVTDCRKWDSGSFDRATGEPRKGWTYIAEKAGIAPDAIRNREIDTETEPEPDNWADRLQRKSAKNRFLFPSLANVDILLRNDPKIGHVFAYNEFSRNPVLVGNSPLFPAGTEWDDNLILMKIKTYCSNNRKYRVDFKNSDVEMKVMQLARENSFHPIKKYLSGLHWDGVQRVERLFIDYAGCDDDIYHRETAKFWMIAAVTRIFEAGHKFDFCPVMSGKQGIGKSSFARILANGWFVEVDDDLKDKKAALEKTEGAWIVELAELASLNHRNVAHVKSFLTDTDNKYRKAYGKRAEANPIQCVYFGSTNDASYLIDKTGNRRFWPINVKAAQIDLAKLEQEREQLWAEAMHLYKSMRAEKPKGWLPLYLSHEANDIGFRLQEEARIESDADEIADAIVRYFASYDDSFDEKPTRINVAFIWSNILNYTGHPNGKTRRDVIDALNRLVSRGKLGKRDRLKFYPVLM